MDQRWDTIPLQLLLLFLTGHLSEFLSRYQCTKKGLFNISSTNYMQTP